MTPDNVKITTWNVLSEAYENKSYYDESIYNYLHWSEGRREKASSYLIGLKSDIYCLREVNFRMALDIYNQFDDNEYELLWQVRTRENKTEYGCAMIYRKNKCQLKQFFVYRYQSGNHIFIASLFDINGKSLWVVDTHINWSSREEDLQDLQEQLNCHLGFTVDNQVIVGDFNAESSEKWYQSLQKNHLTDAFKDHADDYTYNSGKLAKWIDFILLHHLTEKDVIEWTIGNESGKIPLFKEKALPNNSISSDHLPLSISIRI